MFADIAKIAIKTGLIAIVTAAIIAVFSVVQIPSVPTEYFAQAVGMGKAFIQYWVPGYNILFTFGITMLILWITVYALRIAQIALHWIFKVNE